MRASSRVTYFTIERLPIHSPCAPTLHSYCFEICCYIPHSLSHICDMLLSPIPIPVNILVCHAQPLLRPVQISLGLGRAHAGAGLSVPGPSGLRPKRGRPQHSLAQLGPGPSSVGPLSGCSGYCRLQSCISACSKSLVYEFIQCIESRKEYGRLLHRTSLLYTKTCIPLGATYLVTGTWYQVPGSGYMVPCLRYLVAVPDDHIFATSY